MVSAWNRWRRTLQGTLALPAGVAVVLFGTFWLRGVRKAQAGKIYEDMALETTDRLRTIRNEMLSIRAKGEIIDRGTNFDYVTDDRKEKLREFFGWFTELTNLGGAGAAANAVRSPGPAGGP
jgi:hypothetical protein